MSLQDKIESVCMGDIGDDVFYEEDVRQAVQELKEDLIKFNPFTNDSQKDMVENIINWVFGFKDQEQAT